MERHLSPLSGFLAQALARNPDGIATVDGAAWRTWAETAERIARLAGGLARLGVRDSERVAVLAANGAPLFELYFAVPRCGGVLVPLNYRLPEPDLVRIVADAAPRLLLAEPALWELARRLSTALPGLGEPLMLGTAEPESAFQSTEALIRESGPWPDAGAQDSTPAAIFYTGGTTGNPKGVVLSHGNMTAVGRFSAARLRAEWQVFLHAAAMYHTAAVTPVYGVTALAGTHVFLPRFVPGRALELIAAHRVTSTILAPTMIAMLLESPAAGGMDLGSLRMIRYGTSPISPSLLHRAQAWLPHCAFGNGYGLTEASSILARQDAADGSLAPDSPRLFSAGRPIPDVEVRIVDEHDRPLAAGAVGEIVARGASIMQGYWRRPEATREALRGGWLHTGDLGYLDDGGFLFVLDRKDDVIRSGGENVYSTEVEAALSEHPAVQSCAVIGVPDERWGERVHAIVVPKPGATLTRRSLLRFCRQRLAGFKCPRSIAFRPAPLPMTGAGKVLKHVLRAETIAAGSEPGPPESR
ncbi:MAG: class I adenylate-forming enzyme family protein [SAR324 cluster bacterium]